MKLPINDIKEFAVIFSRDGTGNADFATFTQVETIYIAWP